MNRIALAGAALTASTIVAAQTQGPGPDQAPAPGADSRSESEADRAEVVQRLAGALEESYVFPDVARRYAEMLRAKAAAGGYANLGDRFAETVETDLQALHPDRHIRFGSTNQGGPAGPGRRRVMRMPDPSLAIGQSGWIADGVAYIDFGLFPGTPEVLERLTRFLEAHQDARTLIIDIRNHRGGGPAEMDVMFPWLFSNETPLVGMDTRLAVEQRRGGPLREGPTMRRAPGPDGVVRRIHYAVPSARATPLRDARIFLLTSRRSGSAAEHFALALKRTGRATLIGETTAGAGHYGGPVDVGHGYSAFIPVGRSFDPDNDQEWEGVGVSPHIQIPADQALDEALRRAGVDPAHRRQLAPTT